MTFREWANRHPEGIKRIPPKAPKIYIVWEPIHAGAGNYHAFFNREKAKRFADKIGEEVTEGVLHE